MSTKKSKKSSRSLKSSTDKEIKMSEKPSRKRKEKVSTPQKEHSRSNSDLFDYEGKLYAEGSIVAVGYGPYLAKKSKRGRRKKKQPVIPVESENVIEIEPVEEDGEEGDEERWKGEYGEDRPTDIPDDDEIGSDEDEDGVLNPIIVKPAKPKRKKVVREKDIIFKEIDVEILEGEAKAIAKQMGLDYKKSKLVAEPIEYRVVEHDLRYRGYDKYIVARRKKGASSELYLKPYSPPVGGKIEIFDGDYLPPPVPVYAGLKNIEKSTPPDTYIGPLRMGDRVVFTLDESVEKDVEGIVLRVTDTTFTVVDPTDPNDPNGKPYFDVEYKNAQNLRFKPVPDKYIGKKEREIIVGKKAYYIDATTITSKDNYLAKFSRRAPYRYAEFTIVQPQVEHFEGVIMDYTEEGFVVSILEKGMKIPSKTIEVNYNNPTIKKIEPLTKIKDLEHGTVNIAEDYLHLAVDPSTRVNATKRLFYVLSSILSKPRIDNAGALPKDIYDSPVEMDPLLEKLGKNVNWALANSLFEEWSDYYSKQLKSYLSSVLYADLLENSPSFEDDAAIEHDELTNPWSIIEGLVYTFGDIFDGSAARCLAMMNSKASEPDFKPTIIDIAIRRELTKLGDEGIVFREKEVDYVQFKEKGGIKPYKKTEIVIEPKLNDVSGEELARMIARIISHTLKTNPPPSITLIELRMKERWVIDEIDNYNPTKKERSTFDNLYLQNLKERYAQYKLEWEEAKERKNEYKFLKMTLNKEYADRAAIQENVPRLKMLSIDGKQLSKTGLELADAVSMLEQKIYIESSTSYAGDTNQNYLYKMCSLLQFLSPEEDIGKYAKFFQSKIASGMYSIDALDMATQFHMFPEFFANTANSDDVFYEGMKLIHTSIEADVIDFIDIYILNNPPRVRDVTYGSRFLWKNYIVDPAKACGGMRTKPNVMYGGVDNAENYDCEAVQTHENLQSDNPVFVCKAKMEPIPDEDLILCYDEILKKFTCASLNDVLYALWDEDQGNGPINPMTGRPYGDEFLRRMRDRYEDLYDARVEEGIFRKKVMKFKATYDRLFFGGNEPEVIVY